MLRIINEIKLSVIIPCFNEQEVLLTTHDRITKVLSNCSLMDFEIIYVNDGSKDDTEIILEDIARDNKHVRVLNFSRNFGHQPALLAGLNFSSGDVVAIIDADLQDPPELIQKFLELWSEGSDVVYGVRRGRKEIFYKVLMYKAFYFFYEKISNIETQRDSGDFCIMDRSVVNVIVNLPEKNKFLRGLRAWSGFIQTPFEYSRDQRQAGDTKYTYSKLFKLALDGIFNFTTIPLKLIAIFGFVSSLVSFSCLMVLVFQRIFDFPIFSRYPSDVPGWTSLVFVFLFIGSLQLLFLGIIGEYIGRIYEEVKARPPFIIKNTK